MLCEHFVAAYPMLADIWPLYQPPELSPSSGTRLRIALLADPQFASVSPDYANNLYYRSALFKLPALFRHLNAMELDLVVTLGDIVDRYREDYQRILPVYRQLRHPHLFITGNHDAAVIRRQLEQFTPVPALPKHYYAVQTPCFRILVIDGNDVSFYATRASAETLQQAAQYYAALTIAGEPQAESWNGAIGQSQYLWIEQQLEEARQQGQQVIVLGHYPLAPAGKHRLWNGEQIAELLTRYRVVASFHGHDHHGSLETRHHTHFVTVPGLLDTPERAPFMIAEITADGLVLTAGQISVIPQDEGGSPGASTAVFP